MDKKTILVILGTRPEAIKVAPIILELQHYPNEYQVLVCNTEQQKELSNQTLGFFEIKPDFNLNVMTENQTLSGLQNILMERIGTLIQEIKPAACIVQGDTMTAFTGALASFYHKTPVFHIEAGLRSGNLFEPFPEEGLRQMITRISSLHFAPTQQAKDALVRENIDSRTIFITGNTVIDALYHLSEEVLQQAGLALKRKKVLFNHPTVLITIHRRENHGKRLICILEAIKKIAEEFSNHHFILPVHPNPNVKKVVLEYLNNIPNVFLIDPMDYPELIYTMKHVCLILTDSGGIQEEAPSFNVPVLVMRYETERKEGVMAGVTKLVGTDTQVLVRETSLILNQNPKESNRFVRNPYGDGNASKRIKQILDQFFGESV